METNWKIANLKRTPTDGVVIKVTYIINFKLQEMEDRHVGMIILEGDATDPGFIPFEQLTEQTVIGWVQTKLGRTSITEIQDQMQTRLQERLDRKNNTSFITGLPW